MRDTQDLEKFSRDLEDEGYEILKNYLPGSSILMGFEVTDTGDYYYNYDIEGDKYAENINDGTEGAWRE